MIDQKYSNYLNYLNKNNLVPKYFVNDIECIKYIMYFIHPHLDKRYSYYEPWHIFVTFYDLPLKSKQLICHKIKNEVNDGEIINLLNDLELIFK
jgi:hypothetical protein